MSFHVRVSVRGYAAKEPQCWAGVVEVVFHLSGVATDAKCISLIGTIVECDTRMAGRLQSF